MKKIIAKEWRTGLNTTIGIVATEVYNGKWRAYMDVVSGSDENADAQSVADYGIKLSKSEALAFFPYLNSLKFDKEK